jgi:hypothetical protein
MRSGEMVRHCRIAPSTAAHGRKLRGQHQRRPRRNAGALSVIWFRLRPRDVASRTS